ncbi:MAG: endonuclease III [Chloroherpetonaceae bacterium]|nr:endonuclease III [Chloroherpetonaceae bacterium]
MGITKSQLVEKRKEKVLKIASVLGKELPEPKTELLFATPFQLLVSTVLAAQCTDKRINIATAPLYAKYPDAHAIASLSEEVLKGYLKSVNFFNNKTKNVLALSQALVEKFGGEVPQTLEELTSLPGVGRKTAHVVMANCFGKPVLAVDTHVFRVSNRIGIAKAKDVLETEMQLMACIPTEMVADFHHYLILHGRYTCKAQSPNCAGCKITDVCEFYEKNAAKAMKSSKPSKKSSEKDKKASKKK